MGFLRHEKTYNITRAYNSEDKSGIEQGISDRINANNISCSNARLPLHQRVDHVRATVDGTSKFGPGDINQSPLA